MNKKNHNVLDAALNADRKNVLLAIASHERLVQDPFSYPEPLVLLNRVGLCTRNKGLWRHMI